MRLSLAAAFLLTSGCAHSMMTGAERAATAQPPPVPPEGKVALSVTSGDGQQWKVLVGGEAVCATPCTGNLTLGESLALESTSGTEGILIRALPPEVLSARRGVVIAEGSHRGKYVNGVVWTSLGGMALAAGITFTAVGCSDLEDRAGMCSAGLITGGVAAPLTAFGIWLLVDALPRVLIYPHVTPDAAAPQVRLTPVGLAGTF